MYCLICKELIFPAKDLEDLEGYIHPYDFQLCQIHRTSDKMSEEEVKSIVAQSTQEE